MLKNPAWKFSTDSVRQQYVSKITVTIGVTSPLTQISDIRSGRYDLMLGTTVPPAAIPPLLATHDPKFEIWPWTSTASYLVFNLRSPDSGGAAGKLLVRQAIEYGLDKAAVQNLQGGALVSPILSTVIAPGNAGYQDYNPYPDNGGNGNTAMCESDLAKAGYPHGLSLTYRYPGGTASSSLFTAIQKSLRSCGIKLNGQPEPDAGHAGRASAPASNRPGAWDIGQAGQIPDWSGDNGRTTIGRLFQTRCTVSAANYGCYRNKTLDNLIPRPKGLRRPRGPQRCGTTQT